MLLVVLLSLRLRAREMQTMFQLGCSRGTILQLQLAEILIIVAIAAVLVGVAAWGLMGVAGQWVEAIMFDRH